MLFKTFTYTLGAAAAIVAVAAGPIAELDSADQARNTEVAARGIFCPAGQYSCAGNSLKRNCISIEKFCDGVQDCAQNEDEDNEMCKTKAEQANKIASLDQALKQCSSLVGNENGEVPNDFSGTGFMFSVNNMVIDNSNVKMFNQNSDNIEKEVAKK